METEQAQVRWAWGSYNWLDFRRFVRMDRDRHCSRRRSPAHRRSQVSPPRNWHVQHNRFSSVDECPSTNSRGCLCRQGIGCGRSTRSSSWVFGPASGRKKRWLLGSRLWSGPRCPDSSELQLYPDQSGSQRGSPTRRVPTGPVRSIATLANSYHGPTDVALRSGMQSIGCRPPVQTPRNAFDIGLNQPASADMLPDQAPRLGLLPAMQRCQAILTRAVHHFLSNGVGRNCRKDLISSWV